MQKNLSLVWKYLIDFKYIVNLFYTLNGKPLLKKPLNNHENIKKFFFLISGYLGFYFASGNSHDVVINAKFKQSYF